MSGKYPDTYVEWALSKAVSLLDRASPHLDGQARYTVDAARANLRDVLGDVGDSGGRS